MKKIKLAVIFGGMSTEHDVSIVSGISILKNLNKEKYRIYPIYIDEKGYWYKYNEYASVFMSGGFADTTPIFAVGIKAGF